MRTKATNTYFLAFRGTRLEVFDDDDDGRSGTFALTYEFIKSVLGGTDCMFPEGGPKVANQ